MIFKFHGLQDLHETWLVIMVLMKESHLRKKNSVLLEAELKIRDAMRDLVPLLQASDGKFTKVILLHWCFSLFKTGQMVPNRAKHLLYL